MGVAIASILAEIYEWAAGLDYWEQATFFKILTGKAFEEEDYQELLGHLLVDAGLKEPDVERPGFIFPKKIIDTGPGISLKLLSISNLENINALVGNQTLTFSPNLTVIFGRNGSGKSGYARVLGCAGFTRGDKEVLPDITIPSTEEMILSATIEVFDGKSQHEFNYQIGDPCPELASLYVFDSTSVHIHLTGSNTFSFSPSGLHYLTILAEVTDKVRKRLRATIDEYRQPHQFQSLFSGSSWVTEFIDIIGPETHLDVVDQVATLSMKEDVHLAQLETEIAQLRVKDVETEITTIDQKESDLENLNKNLDNITSALLDENYKAITDSVIAYESLGTRAKNISVQKFRAEGFTQIGSEEWQNFILAAKTLAELESDLEISYPSVDSRCLLCHQPLSDEARGLIISLWEFLESEAQTRFENERRNLDEIKKSLKNLDFAFFQTDTASYRSLDSINKLITPKVTAYIDALHQRRDSFIQIIEDCNIEIKAPSILPSPTKDIDEEISSLKREKISLLSTDIQARFERLNDELSSLQHRKIVHANLDDIKSYIERRKWAKRASKIGGSTRHITGKYKETFSRLVTNRYLELFSGILAILERPLKVKVETSGRKGETYKQIVLETVASTESISPEKVLSEGEKRAVAIADFLTEVALDETSSSIILDDPVTSLDLEWRETIAQILAKEANNRQVVVFTHDLPFLYFLKRDAEKLGVNLATHWVKRGEIDDKPGYLWLDDSPALEKEYKTPKRANEFYRKAKGAQASDQETLLRLGFGALRSTYEAFIVFGLFGGVVNRFEERISFSRLKDVVWDKEVITRVVEKCEHLSRYIEGHLHSDAFARMPSCEDLLNEIKEYESLKTYHKKLKKASRS